MARGPRGKLETELTEASLKLGNIIRNETIE
jgi:hypothetical protein